MSRDYHREYQVRLPLPLAQLYERAFNAPAPRARHDYAYHLFEATIKLTAIPAVACYLHEVEHGAERSATLDRILIQLALPSLGQWVGMLRELTRHFGQRPDAPSHPLGHLAGQLDRPRRDRPELLALYRRIKDGADGQPAGDQSCSLLEVFDALVRYRNGVFGHGGPRFDSFYESEMGPLLFPAADELLEEGTLDLLGPGGSRLVYLAELRQLDQGVVEIGVRDLVGLRSERAAHIHLDRNQATSLEPGRVAVVWPGWRVPLRLDPLLLFREGELSDEVLFLNRDLNGRQVQYLSYTTGRTDRDRSTAPALMALLSRVRGQEADNAQLEAMAEQCDDEVAKPKEFSSPPARMIDDYEILNEIGHGGMGVVYLARQRSLGRLVAIKTLHAELAGDETTLARFRREVRLLANCDHPNLVKVLASGTMSDGQLYYVMEYIPGCDLDQIWRELAGSSPLSEVSSLGGGTWDQAVDSVSRRKQEQLAQRSPDRTAGPGSVEAAEPSPPDLPLARDERGGFRRRVARIIRDAAMALQAIHSQGVIHRDVKPANLMLTQDGSRVVLMDFGLAKGQSLDLMSKHSGGLLVLQR